MSRSPGLLRWAQGKLLNESEHVPERDRGIVTERWRDILFGSRPSRKSPMASMAAGEMGNVAPRPVSVSARTIVKGAP
jgi:hypothetical protein